MSSRRSFHCMHATWQALQPMHLEMSISFATGVAVARTEGDAVVVALRSSTSSDCMDAMTSSYAFSRFTRNALYSGVWQFASATYGVSVFVRNPLFATPMNPQWI